MPGAAVGVEAGQRDAAARNERQHEQERQLARRRSPAGERRPPPQQPHQAGEERRQRQRPHRVAGQQVAEDVHRLHAGKGHRLDAHPPHPTRPWVIERAAQPGLGHLGGLSALPQAHRVGDQEVPGQARRRQLAARPGGDQASPLAVWPQAEQHVDPDGKGEDQG